MNNKTGHICFSYLRCQCKFVRDCICNSCLGKFRLGNIYRIQGARLGKCQRNDVLVDLVAILADGLTDGLGSSIFSSSEDWNIFAEVGVVDWESSNVDWVIFSEVCAVDWATSDVNWVILE
jgi:hypothetical protein